ncbi:hypothetical protein OQA88_9180 [Cercophora sp. LCS_1]
MKYATTLLAALVAQQSTAFKLDGFEIEWSGSQNGVPLPESEFNLTKLEFVPGSSTPVAGAKLAARANKVENSGNYCGTVGRAQASNRIKFITGTFNHPGCSPNMNFSRIRFPQAVAPWVGIDGDTYTSSLVQAGTNCVVNDPSGSNTHMVWVQWVPGSSYTLPNFPVSPGNVMKVDITVNTPRNATLVIQNQSTGRQERITWTADERGAGTIGGIDADWIAETPQYFGQLLDMPKFDEVTFRNARATRLDNSNLGVLGAIQKVIPGQCSSVETGDSSLRAWSP